MCKYRLTQSSTLMTCSERLMVGVDKALRNPTAISAAFDMENLTSPPRIPKTSWFRGDI